MNIFFKAFFASLLAMVVFSLLMVFVIGGVVASFSKSLEQEEVKVEPNSLLLLDLNYDMPEQTSTGFPITPLGLLNPDLSTGLNEMLAVIEQAKTDPNIKGIVLRMGYNLNPYATLEELRNALMDFKENSDKFIIAYGEVVNQSAYYLGSVANEVYLNPAGAMEFKGLAAQLTFIKGSLDKLGIETQVFWAGDFKSATEPLRLDKMSAANREQLRDYIGGLYGQILTDIGTSRNIPTDSLRQIANRMEAWFPASAMRVGLVDGLLYEDQLTELLQEKLGLDAMDAVPTVNPAAYARTIKKASGNWENQIAVVYADGSIVDGDGENGSIGSDSYRKIFADIRKDNDIKAVVVRINSGGGSAIASDVIWREISQTKEKKPVVVSMGDYAASGGYMMACNANTVFAQPNTLTGSIGVFLILPDVSRFLEDKLGITSDTVLTGTYADFPTINRPVSEGERAILQAGIDTTYMHFKQMVAQGRGLSMEEVENLAKGRVWLGTTALALGLVDSLGGLQDAIGAAVQLAGLDGYRISEYPQHENGLWEELFLSIAREQDRVWMESELGVLFAPYAAIKQYMDRPQVRAELPYLIDIR